MVGILQTAFSNAYSLMKISKICENVINMLQGSSWWFVNIGRGNDLVPWGNKSSFQLMLDRIYNGILQLHWATMS